MPRTRQRTNDLRERGIIVAMDLLAEEGPAGLTTRNFARRVDASLPAVYEVFGDKAGIVREVFFQGFRMLGDALAEVPETENPLDGLRGLAQAYRDFVISNPELAQVMFSRPFADFDPTTADNKAGVKVRKIFLQRARAAIDAGLIDGDPTDIAHVFFGLFEGLAAAEGSQRLGSSKAARDRRWDLGLETLFAGFGAPRKAAAISGRRPSRKR